MLEKLLRPLHPSWGFYTAVWGIIVGVITALSFGQIVVTDYWFIFASFFLIILCLHHSSLLTILIIFLASFLIGNFRVRTNIASQASILPHYGQTVTLSGKLSEEPDDSKNPIAIRLQDPVIHTEPQVKLSGTIYLTLSGTPNLERSDVITVEGKLGEGFGTFLAKMSRPKIINIERSDPGDIFAQFKRWFADTVRQFIPSSAVDLGLGYLMGMKTGLPTEFSEALCAVGMTHVVVASGAHLAILTGAAKKLFGKISKFAGLLFSLLMILAFVMVVGFTPSMTRAALVASLSLLVGYVGRTFTPLRLIGFVAMLTLLINPMYFLNLGWQLSFASFFGILVLAPRLQRTFYGRKTPPWLASMLLTSLSTCLVCAPILIYNFGSISLLSFVANLIILPTLPYAMLGMMFTGIASPIPILANFIARLTTLLLNFHIWLVEFLSQKTMFILELPAGDAKIFLLYLPIMMFLCLPTLRKYYRNLRTKSAPPNVLEPI